MELQILLRLLLALFCFYAQLSPVHSDTPPYSIHPYKPSLLNFAQPQCESDHDCAINGTGCFKGHCLCSWGFYNSIALDSYGCESYSCSFDVDDRANVTAQLCDCSVSSSLNFDHKSQTCQQLWSSSSHGQAYQLIQGANYSLTCIDDQKLCSVRFGPGTRSCVNASSSSSLDDCECKNMFWFNPKEKICIQISEVSEDEDKSFFMKHRDLAINILIGCALACVVYLLYSSCKQEGPHDIGEWFPPANLTNNVDLAEYFAENGLLEAYLKHKAIEEEYKSKVPDPPPTYDDALVNSDVVQFENASVPSPPSYNSVITVPTDDDDALDVI